MFGLSDRFEPRNKAPPQDKGYAWAPVSGVFDKLREVGVLSYLFYPLFKCFVMLELIEAVSGCLIGPKTWDRSVKICGTRLDSP